jgi:perosamine synthetase
MSTATPIRPGFDLPPTAGLALQFGDLLPAALTRLLGGGARPTGTGRDATLSHAGQVGTGDDLEHALAGFIGLPEVQITCSGTAALVIALTALARQTPDRRVVIVPAYTCPLVALAVKHCALELQVCELLPDSLDMDPADLARLCDRNALAVIPTHMAGRIADVATACLHARAVGAWVIEDAAQALGATIDGKSVGLLGDVGFFSLAVGKGLTMFEGGVLFTQHAHFREPLRQVAQTVTPPKTGWELRRSIELLAYAAVYRPAGLRLAYGRPLRRDLAHGDWIAAAGDEFDLDIPLHRPGRWRQSVARRAFMRLPAFLDETAKGAAVWRAMLRLIPGVTMLDDAAGQGVWPVMLVLLPSKVVRDAVLDRLWGSGYGLSLPFVHTLPDYTYLQGIVPAAGPDALPQARRLAGRMLAIGNSPWVTDADRDVVCAVLQDCLAAGSE